jgi:branched-chain amino acid transport system substrate-binding protein
MQRWHKLVALVTGLAVLAGVGATARIADAAPNANAPIQIGVVYGRTGLLSAYGAEYIQGLRYGLAYATKGTNAVNGRKIELTLVDDANDPVKAVGGAKDLIGKGYKIIAGTVSSGIAPQLATLADQNKVLYISGPAATDAVTGINKYTFRSGRQSVQDVLTAGSYLGGAGKNVTVFAQDSAFGQGNYLAVKALMEDLGGNKVSRVLVPLSAQDFTPFAQQVKQQKTDLLFVAWAGTTAPAMWRALEQQNVFGSVDKVVTGLAERATYPTFGPIANKISFLSHYVYNAPKNKVNDWLVASMKKRGQLPDLFTPDGFVAGQMIVRALTKGSADDVDKMISALEGWSFTGPKGQQTIRASDHAMLQPMFQVKLTENGGKYTTQVTKALRAKYTAPPEKK